MFEKNKNYMDIQKGNMEYYRKKYFWKRSKILLVSTFLIVLFIIAFTSLPDFRTTITGNVIGRSNIDLPEGILISADLTVPNISSKESFEKVEITGLGGAIINIGNQKVSLTRKTIIILEDYEGQINIDPSKTSINGKASTILIKGVPITANAEGSKITINGELEYSSLEINGFSIANLDYVTSGKLEVNKETELILNNERIVIESFNGELTIRNEHFRIDGVVQKIDIKGEREISFSTNS